MEHKPIDKYKVELKEVSLEGEETFKKITCPSCSNNVPADNININDKIAKCNSCDVVFPFEKEIAKLLPQQRMKQEVIRPEGIEIFHYRNELDISVTQPYRPIEIIAMIISSMFAVGGINIYAAGGVGWLGLGVLLFIGLAPYLNLFFRSKHKIHVNIDNKYLYIEWRPRKFVKDKRYEIDDIDQIYTKTTNNQHYVYMIVNGSNGQKHIPLIKNIGSMSKARYLEQEIENHLGIIDRQVPEESI